MKKWAVLFVSLALLLSCEYKPPDTADFAKFIKPEEREDFLSLRESLPYYHIGLVIDRKTRRVDGMEEIRWHNGGNQNLGELKFRLLVNNKVNRPMSIRSISRGDTILTGNISVDGTTLTVPLPLPLPPGEDMSLTISYTLDYENPPDNYFDFDRIDDKGFSLAHFYPVAVPRSKGLWEDTPLHTGGDLLNADSSWFLVEVKTDKAVTIAASGRVLHKQAKGNRQEISYIAGPVRDFYLCAATDFIVTEINRGNTTIRSFSPSSLRDSSRRAAEITSQALDLFSREFGSYPFRELKIAALPMSALGIEFPAFFAIRKNLYEDQSAYLFEPTIVHEAAHQWFYSLMGNNQLTDPWIDEGLAQYASWYYLKDKYGNAGAEGMYNSFMARWNRIGKRPLPIGKPVSFYSPLEYGAIIYGRAPLFFIDAGKLMGEKRFHEFLKSTVDRYRNRRIDTNTFLALMRDAAGPGFDALKEEYF